MIHKKLHPYSPLEKGRTPKAWFRTQRIKNINLEKGYKRA
jgi:hypothetical protein